jgi:WD40 repeat protein
MHWDLSTGKVLHTLEGRSGKVTSVVISPEGMTAVSGSGDNTLKLWDLSSGKVMASFVGDSRIKCLTISSDGRVVLAGEKSGHIHFLRLEGI